ncbi:MAG: Ldh family oxidoreductase [Candidatus Thorarchaeota archaeon]|jgi:LDH2 family malate/lactate/ureidoglycolate dehydrogenase
MTQREVRIAWEKLYEFTKEIFLGVGVSPEDAATQADVLIWANLRGVDSHGVTHVPWYIEAIDIGHIKKKPHVQIVKETPATLFLDADHALGPVVTTFAMNQAIDKAKKVGIGWAFIRNTGHQGAIGYYPLMAVKKDMAGIAWVCSAANTAPYGAKSAGVSNNPIAIAVPAKRHHPLILDMATSIAAASKIFVARDRGTPIPKDWALDKYGNLTTDPLQASILMPLGGLKGSGLSLMLECLASIVVDNPKLEPILQGKEKPLGLEPIAGHPDRIRRRIQNSVVAAINISEFISIDTYKEHIDNLIDGLKALPKAEGFREVLVPGEPEWRNFVERSRSGIPLPNKTLDSLRNVAKRFNITGF